jgi:hypothetical protein
MNEPKFKVGDQVEYTGLTGTKGDRFIGSVDYVYSTIDANGNTRGTSFQDKDLRLAPLKPLKVGDLVDIKLYDSSLDGVVVYEPKNSGYCYGVYIRNDGYNVVNSYPRERLELA